MQKKSNLYGLLALSAVAITLMPEAHAASTGGVAANMDQVYCDVRNLTTGNVGSIIGFGFAFLGLLTLLLKGSNYGIILIIIGIAVTAFPGLLNSFIEGMSNVTVEADPLAIGDCNSSGELPSVDSITETMSINAIRRGTDIPPDPTTITCPYGTTGPC